MSSNPKKVAIVHAPLLAIPQTAAKKMLGKAERIITLKNNELSA
jgi:hypothetical protein